MIIERKNASVSSIPEREKNTSISEMPERKIALLCSKILLPEIICKQWGQKIM